MYTFYIIHKNYTYMYIGIKKHFSSEWRFTRCLWDLNGYENLGIPEVEIETSV